MTKLSVGQRVFCSLPYCGSGIVVGITGEQSVGQGRSMGGVIAMSGRATFDIVWSHGARSWKTPETLVKTSPQWTVHDEILPQEEVDRALARSDAYKHAQAAEAASKANAFEAARQELLKSPVLSKLKRADLEDESSIKIASANLKKLLKMKFPRAKFSVRGGRSGGAINISWAGGPEYEKVKEIADCFKGGSFDSMTDCYEFNKTPWNELFGSARFVFLNRQED